MAPIRLRERGQGDRLQWWRALVDRLPDFFGDERHHRVEQPQRGFKKIYQVRASLVRFLP